MSETRYQVVRELPDREDVDEVEEQLQRGDDALRARETAIRIAAILAPQGLVSMRLASWMSRLSIMLKSVALITVVE